MDNGLVQQMTDLNNEYEKVLILVVVDNGLIQTVKGYESSNPECLNPYCSGQWSHTSQKSFLTFMLLCLNPCCNGRWSRTAHTFSISGGDPVLILVVMEDGLVPFGIKFSIKGN